MATIKYLVKGNGNPASIYLRFIHGRKHDYTKGTGYLINPKDWNLKKKLPYQRDAELKNLNSDLLNLSHQLIQNFNNTPKDEINSSWLENQIGIIKGDIKPEQTRSDILTECVQYVIDTANIRLNSRKDFGLSKSRINSYENLLKMIRSYQGANILRVKDVNYKFSISFLDWMINKKGYAESYSRKKIDDLKTVCKDASYDGVEVSLQLGKIKGGKPTNDYVIFFTEKELEQIEKTDLIGDALNNARRWLLIGCNIGQRGGDLLKLTNDNIIIRNGLKVIELKQKKTGSDVTIPLLSKTEELLKDGFPRPISIQKFNEYIKVICKKAEINELTKGRRYDSDKKRRVEGVYKKWEVCSSHIMRRTFASLTYGNLPTPLIMKITSHKTEKVFAQYLGKDSLDYAQQIADYYELQALKNKQEPQLEIVKEGTNN